MAGSCQELKGIIARVQEGKSAFTKIISLFLNTYLNWTSQDFKLVSSSACTAHFRRDLLSGDV